MAYGRLDIFVPDGPIQTFPLAETTVSVGRSAGNTIVLDNNTISRYHFSLTYANKQVFLTDMDSANGTYLDGVKLPGNERRQLMDGDEILIGNLRIIYHEVDDTPTVRLDPLEDTTQRIEMALTNFYIDLQGPGQSVAPGAHISAELSITNTTDTDERYKVEVSGPPEDWVRIDRPTPLVAAGETSFILVNFKPRRHSSSKPGDYDVRVRVFPKNEPKDVLEARLTLTVLAYSGFSIQLDKNDVEAGERFRITVENTGSAELPLSLRGRDPNSELAFRLANTRFTLGPGQQRVIEGEVRSRKSVLVGSPRRYAFDLLAQSHNHAAFTIPLRGHVTVKPSLPVWTLAALASGLAIVALIALVVLASLLNAPPPPQPVISELTVNSTLVARGEVLEVSWQATDVTTLNLSLNGTPVAIEADPQRVSVNVDTTDLNGDVEVRLEGHNGELSDIRSTTIQVYEPMSVERFEVMPAQMVRYVIQPLSVNWEVPGAVSTRVVGLENFTAETIAADGPSGASESILGIPTDPLVLRLIAEDAFGNMLESRVTVNMVNPECVPASGAVRVFAGPGPAHQVVGTVPEATIINVDARDNSGGWLRVIGLPGGLSGWVTAATVDCMDSFNINDLRIDANAPTPPPTATATLSPTPTVIITPTSTMAVPTLAPPTLVSQFTPSG
ncbi:MAG: hypothetical protein CL610_22485 [Anaerolineaceae bacterium]|nr:hypothetical protein [Anaerolineaceae bacterium]